MCLMNHKSLSIGNNKTKDIRVEKKFKINKEGREEDIGWGMADNITGCGCKADN